MNSNKTLMSKIFWTKKQIRRETFANEFSEIKIIIGIIQGIGSYLIVSDFSSFGGTLNTVELGGSPFAHFFH